MDGVTISVDMSMLGLMVFIVYKIVQIEYRLKRIEEVLDNGSHKD